MEYGNNNGFANVCKLKNGKQKKQPAGHVIYGWSKGASNRVIEHRGKESLILVGHGSGNGEWKITKQNI